MMIVAKFLYRFKDACACAGTAQRGCRPLRPWPRLTGRIGMFTPATARGLGTGPVVMCTRRACASARTGPPTVCIQAV